ncbi:MAG: YkgJ family cysteine cluster protein [Desulfobacula sp.]|nr:YkgJ family cysteine cluster protein [Desulfobacula sp.]
MDCEYKTCDDIFECQQCGACCKGYGGTYVTKQNIDQIAAYINFDPNKFIGTYCDKSGSKYVLTRGSDGYCIFFNKTRQCTIHPVKPYMCRAWPFIQSVIDYPENWNIMANSCPGMKKDIPHKELVQIVKSEKENMDNKN